MSNTNMWALIVGFFSPIAIQVITTMSDDSRVQALIAFLFSAVVAVPTVYFAGDLAGAHSYVTNALIILVATIASYKGFWSQIGVTPSTVRIDRSKRTP